MWGDMARILSAALRLGAADSVLFDHAAGMVRDAGDTPSGLAMPLVDSTSLFNSLALAAHHQPDVLDALGVSVLENAERLSPAMIGSLLRALRAAADQGSSPSPTLSEREFFIDNPLVRIHLIIVMISVDRPCAMGV